MTVSKWVDILSETVIEDGLIKETITVNGVTGSIYYEEIKPKSSENEIRPETAEFTDY